VQDTEKDEFIVSGKDLIQKVKLLLKESNVHRIIIFNEKDEKIFEVPLIVGIFGIVTAPVIAGISGLIGMSVNYKIKVLRKPKSE
jgi:repressor of nif and glnA expression